MKTALELLALALILAAAALAECIPVCVALCAQAAVCEAAAIRLEKVKSPCRRPPDTSKKKR